MGNRSGNQRGKMFKTIVIPMDGSAESGGGKSENIDIPRSMLRSASKKAGDSRPSRGITLSRLREIDPSPTLGEFIASGGTWADLERYNFERILAGAARLPSMRIGSGATASREEAEYRARKLFYWAMYSIVPETTTHLLTSDALTAEEGFWALHSQAIHLAAELDPNGIASLEALYDVSSELREAGAVKSRHIKAWQGTWNLKDGWLFNVAWHTLRMAHDMRRYGLVYVGPLGLGEEGWSLDIPDDDGEGIDDHPEVIYEHGTPVYPIYPEDLLESLEVPWLDLHDPDRESVVDSRDRIIDALKLRIESKLEAIRANHIEQTGARKATALDSVKDFERLVRFQVLGESQRKIAIDEACGDKKRGESIRRSVVRAIHEKKDWIGLTLRT